MGRIVCVKCNVILNEFFNQDEIDLHQCGKKYLTKSGLWKHQKKSCERKKRKKLVGFLLKKYFSVRWKENEVRNVFIYP